MRTQSADTSPEMERVQIELLRKAPITQKFAMVESCPGVNSFWRQAEKAFDANTQR